MNNSPLLPWAYNNRRVEPLMGRGGWTEVNNSPLLLSANDNRIVEHFVGGGGTVVNNSPLLLSAYDNRIVEHLLDSVGGEQGRIIVPSLIWHIITR